MSNEGPVLSVVVAAYNEGENLPVLRERITRIDWGSIGVCLELVFVDDHSSDGTYAVLRRLASLDQRVRVLRLSKNFGSHRAFTAGLEHCAGDAAVILAADLQDPPEVIPEMVEKWRKGAKVVWAVRGEREGVGFFDRVLARGYYGLMRRFSEVQPPRDGADFLLVDRCVLDVLRGSPEKHTSVLSLIQWMGFSQDSITYTKAARHSGRSKWTLSKKVKLVIDSFVSFSFFPIRAATLMGLTFGLLGLVAALAVVVRTICFGTPLVGWPSLVCVVLITSGVQLIMLGVLGEYLWRAYDESRGRPRYIIEEKINF